MLAEALRLMRVFHDVKQTELAQRLSISKSHLCEIERGRKQPTLALIDRYAAEFGIPRSSILFFAEGLESPSKSANAAQRGRGAIARKVVHFLRLIEERTEHAEQV
ncbi:MAG: helix-turn-helix transcriptional regulator [Thiotrichales bacterium]|nr:helix-turn-helix transcriptional regulator [Thiotrichales bacterium]MCY4349748.1 helix-turn-helix transcriptional regulator [Thiotrichales bacterium]